MTDDSDRKFLTLMSERVALSNAIGLRDPNTGGWHQSKINERRRKLISEAIRLGMDDALFANPNPEDN